MAKQAHAVKPGSDAGQRNILKAAREAFATYGFEGASLRAISTQAGTLHSAMLYHFPSKDALWRAVMGEIFEDLEARIAARMEEMRDCAPDAVARRIVRDFVLFCAERPELHRIMTIEGRSDTPRLAWLVKTYTKRLFDAVASMTAQVRPGVFEDSIQLYFALIGLSASAFSLAPEFKRLSGRTPFSAHQIDATARMVERVIFGPETPEAKDRK